MVLAALIHIRGRRRDFQQILPYSRSLTLYYVERFAGDEVEKRLLPSVVNWPRVSIPCK